MGRTLADLIAQRFGMESETGRDMAAEGTLATILGHRSCRRFAKAQVPDELLDLLLAAAFSAPSKSDLQQASVVIVRDKAKRRAFEDLLPSMPWIAEAPVFMVFCGDGRRIRRICEMRGRPFAADTADGFMNAAVDAALVMQAFILAAEAAGLGCCPISAVRDPVDKVSALLDLPGGVFPMAGLCAGYPADEGHVSMRLPPTLTVHVDGYDDSGLAALVEDYDRRRDARHSIVPEKQRHVDRYGCADFYGWSEDKARQVSRPERTAFGAYLAKQGFSLT